MKNDQYIIADASETDHPILCRDAQCGTWAKCSEDTDLKFDTREAAQAYMDAARNASGEPLPESVQVHHESAYWK